MVRAAKNQNVNGRLRLSEMMVYAKIVTEALHQQTILHVKSTKLVLVEDLPKLNKPLTSSQRLEDFYKKQVNN